MGATTIAVLGDTHDSSVGLEQVLLIVEPVLFGADLILHTGDVTSIEMLDALEKIAPVMAVRSTADPEDPPRLVDGPRRVEVEGLQVELHRSLEPDQRVEREDLRLVIHGGTHSPELQAAGKTLYLNPGAPVFADVPSGARVEIDDGAIRATIVLLG
jgi:uncharacterized protein